MRARLALSGLLATATLAASCGTNSSPAAPRSPTASPLAWVVAGTVYEHTVLARRTLPGLTVRILSFTPLGAVTREGTSDAAGRYTIADVPVGSLIIAPHPSAAYFAPCPAGGELNYGGTVDLHVVSAEVLSTTGVPSTYPTSALWFSGIVFENTARGKLPVAGANVSLTESQSTAVPTAFATTVSDAEGRYLVCTAPPGAGTDQMAWLSVRKDGFITGGRPVLPGSDAGGTDVQLERTPR